MLYESNAMAIMISCIFEYGFKKEMGIFYGLWYFLFRRSEIQYVLLERIFFILLHIFTFIQNITQVLEGQY